MTPVTTPPDHDLRAALARAFADDLAVLGSGPAAVADPARLAQRPVGFRQKAVGFAKRRTVKAAGLVVTACLLAVRVMA